MSALISRLVVNFPAIVTFAKQFFQGNQNIASKIMLLNYYMGFQSYVYQFFKMYLEVVLDPVFELSSASKFYGNCNQFYMNILKIYSGKLQCRAFHFSIQYSIFNIQYSIFNIQYSIFQFVLIFNIQSFNIQSVVLLRLNLIKCKIECNIVLARSCYKFGF